jgi:hypothetical protein
MLKSSEEALLKNKIATTVKRLSIYKGNLPDTNNAQEVAAGELFLAMEVKRHADSIVAAARENCIIQGVTFDTSTSVMKGKESKQLFDGEHIAVYVNVNEGPTIYPFQSIRAEMVKHKIDGEVIDAIFKAAGRKNANAHRFSAVLKTERDAEQVEETRVRRKRTVNTP